MRVAVNTRLLLKNKLDGIGWFTYESLKRITRQHADIEFVFIFDRPWDDEFIFSSNVVPVSIGPASRHPVLWYLWFEYSVPKILKKFNVDLFLSPDGYLSLNTKVPSVNVIHDINFHHRPKDLPVITRKYYQYYYPRFARKATRIGTVSNYSKEDISDSYKVDPKKIDIIYNGANPIYKPISTNEKLTVKEKYTSGADYFIFVGSLHPRKNVERLLKAFDLFRQKSNRPYKLMIIGEKFFKTGDIERTYGAMSYKEDVIFQGRLSPDILSKVMAAASALVFVPLFEGFGIPNVEAMYCDVPVISSNVTSIPEVVGDAGLLVNPFSIEEIKEAMIKITTDDKLRENMIKKARQRRELFSWDKTAESLWKCIEKCM